MKKASPDSDSLTDRIFSLARSKAHGPAPSSTNKSQDSNVEQKTSSPSPQFPVTNEPAAHNALHSQQDASSNIPPFPSTNADGLKRQPSKPAHNQTSDTSSTDNPPPAPPPQVDGSGNIIENGGEGDGDNNKNPNVMMRFWITMKTIVLSSYINLLLVFVPVGIVAKAVNLAPGAIFGLNAIAIVPLAGLLSHATESVAKRMGDTVGALMNVTFGNAVELIIFIALQKNEIRIVQASLLGSILANLLLILGMCFLVGGLRFREQIYNSTVTQMSACLLSLAVMSLLLPTAFHASFSTASVDKANSAVLKVSRGTSVILLLVYGFYLLFQLKSHAYMYESTPQHIIDEELAPGPVAAWMDTSSDDSSSSSSDSDSSSGSNNTAKRIKRVMRAGRRRRKSSAESKDGHEAPIRTPSIGTSSITPVATDNLTEEPEHASFGHRLGAIDFGEEGGDEAPARRSRKNSYTGSHILSKKALKKERKREEKRAKKEHKTARRNAHNAIAEGVVSNSDGLNEKEPEGLNDPRRVDFAVNGNANVNEDLEAQTTPGMGDASPSPKRNIFGSIRPQIPKTFSQNVFTSPGQSATPPPPTGPVPRVRYGIRRTNSLPDRLNQTFSASGPGRNLPPGQLSKTVSQPVIAPPEDIAEEENISRTTAVVLLLISTGLVAVCAEFMVDSINAVVSGNSGLSEAFVGLIILPIVGNAAEHVTAVTVASKNKMDLAIGVAVGSSIQIALFVTPFIVLLGWCMSKDMTLYFTLFETVSLFVSAFIVNFLVLDGRSNYLEGALLCAAYIIIAVAAFFYPAIGDSSNLGGNADAEKMKRDLVASVLAPIFGTSGM